MWLDCEVGSRHSCAGRSQQGLCLGRSAAAEPGPDPSLLPNLAQGSPLLGVGAGSTGTSALFYNDTGDASRAFLVSDANGGHWRFLPAFPTADVVCPVAGSIVAVETGEVAPDGVVSSPNPLTLRAPPVGLDRGALWYEPASHRWNDVPPIGAANSFGPGRIVAVHGTKVFSTIASRGSDATLFVLSAGATAWMQHSFPAAALSSFQALDDLILVVAADQRGSEHLTIGLLDSGQLPAAGQPKDSVGTSK